MEKQNTERCQITSWKQDPLLQLTIMKAVHKVETTTGRALRSVTRRGTFESDTKIELCVACSIVGPKRLPWLGAS